jgi:hypothetical protein
MDIRLLQAVGIIGAPLVLLYGVYLLGYYRGRFVEVYTCPGVEDSGTQEIIATLRTEVDWIRDQLDSQLAHNRSIDKIVSVVHEAAKATNQPKGE